MKPICESNSDSSLVVPNLFNAPHPQNILICSRTPYNTCNDLFKNEVERDRRKFV